MLFCTRSGCFFMSAYDITRLSISLIAILVILIYFVVSILPKNMQISTKFISRTAIFAALSTILYVVPYLKFPVPFFPNFLEIHLDEIPTLIAGFAYGPLSAIFIIVIKTLIKLPMTSTMCVGELADLIYSLAFILPCSLIYKKHRTFKGAIVSISVGTVFQLVVSSLVTSFGMLNFYMAVMGLSEETIINMCKAINPNVTSLGWTFLVFVALPFNAFKDAIVIVATLLLYKRIRWLIEKISA